MIIRADFHIHSCLSPCGSLELSPRAIVHLAEKSGLDLIALTDHNSALNCSTLKQIVEKKRKITAFYGIECTSIEEVHSLALFDNLDTVLEFGVYINDRLTYLTNNPELFGDQVYVDEDEVIIGRVGNYLGAAIQMSVDDLEREVHSRNGLFIPSHVDRMKNSLYSQLGFVPEGKYDAIEISKRYYLNNPGLLIPGNTDSYTAITGSDSHYPDDFGSAYTEIECDEISVESIRQSLREGKVRRVIRNAGTFSGHYFKQHL